MRYIFITLVLVNLAYFGYQWWQQQPEESEGAQTRAQQGELIRMLDEGPVTAGRRVLQAPAPAAGESISRVILNPVSGTDEIAADSCPAVGPYLNLLPGQQSLEIGRAHV